MTAANLYTRRISGIDYRVWIAMLLTCLLCLAFYGYRQMQISSVNTQPCSSSGIRVNTQESKALVVNQTYIFKIQTEAAAKVEWEFDGVKSSDNGQIVQYKFMEEGIFKVTARVNGGCKFEKEVTVREPFLLPQEKPFLKIIVDSANPKVGTTVKFYCITNQPVNSYEWKWLEGNEVQQNKIGEFTFNTTGKYTVQLMVNNDPLNLIATKIDVTQNPLPEINLDNPSPGNLPSINGLKPGEDPYQKNPQPKPNPDNSQVEKVPDKPKEEPAKPKPTEIHPETFKGMLQEVLDGDIEIEKLYEYLFYKEETKVQDGKKRMKLKEFCDKKRNKKIKSLKFQKDESGIQVLIVEIKGGIFGL